MTSIAIVISYLGWVGAQISALGLVFNVVSAGEISKVTGMWIGSGTILIYTLFGGMWAVAITDFIQMIVIVIGMLFIGHEVSSELGGVGVVVAHASQAGKFEFWPKFGLDHESLKAMIGFFAAWITMMLGSMPQQDVFQRITSSKNVNIAVNAAILGGVLYFIFAFVPMYQFHFYLAMWYSRGNYAISPHSLPHTRGITTNPPWRNESTSVECNGIQGFDNFPSMYPLPLDPKYTDTILYPIILALGCLG